MWSNLITCKIIYDRNGRLTRAKERFNVKYPIELKQNIIKRNMRLLHNSMLSYNHQILKAVSRNDKVNLGNRVTAFMDSYFDVMFALNEITHPGEKRLVQKCKEQCEILPNNFEKNIGRNIKATGLYFLLGIVITVLFQMYILQEGFASLFSNKGFGVLMVAILGVPVYVCGGGTIPLNILRYFTLFYGYKYGSSNLIKY